MSTLGYQPAGDFLDNTSTHGLPGVTIDPTADVHPNVAIRGTVTIGAYCQIEAGVVLAGEAVVIGSHTVIKANASLRGNIVVGDCVLIGEQVNIEGGRPGNYTGSATCLIPDKAIVGSGTVIGAGTAMHGTQIGENCIIGIRCAFDYNTRIGKDCVIKNGAATIVDQIIPDHSLVTGVPARIVKCDIDDADCMAELDYIPAQRAAQMRYRLEERQRTGLSLKDYSSKTILHIAADAYVHPTAVLEGVITIGSNAVVDAGSILIGEIQIGDGARIKTNAVVKGQVEIGEKTFLMGHTVVDASSGLGVDILMNGAIQRISVGNCCYLDQGAVVRGANLANGVIVGQVGGCDFGAVVEENAAIASASIVDRYDVVGRDCFVEGLPAKLYKNGLTDEDRYEYFGFISKDLIEGLIPDQAEKRAEQAKVKNIHIHPDTRIEHNVWFEGNITVDQYNWIDIGAILCGNVHVGYNSLTRCNVSLDGNITVGKQTHLYDQMSYEGDCSIGDYCWMNHGGMVSNAVIGNDSSVSLCAAAGYHSAVEDGAVVSNHTVATANTVVRKNTRIEGVPAQTVQKFMELEDRQLYFGVSPLLWTPVQGKWIEDDIIKRRSEQK